MKPAPRGSKKNQKWRGGTKVAEEESLKERLFGLIDTQSALINRVLTLLEEAPDDPKIRAVGWSLVASIEKTENLVNDLERA